MLRSMLATCGIIAVFVFLGTLAGVIGIPYSIAVGNVRLLYRVALKIMRLGVRSAGIRVDVRGRENIPQGVTCIFLSNHASNLDPPILFPEMPLMTSVLLKQELMRIPLLGIAMRLGKFVPVERSDSRNSARRTVDAARDALNSGLHLLTFPEGTRTRDGRLGAFKKGPFFLAQQTGSLIVPVAISGTWEMMPRGSFIIRPGTVRVTLLPAVDPKDFRTRAELIASVRSAIDAVLQSQQSDDFA